MSQGRLSKRVDDGKKTGIILACWDHEKTPILLQDLESSINFAERKCKKLLKELIQYKKFLEESGEYSFHRVVPKRKIEKPKNSHLFSGSDSDIAFRKNVINFKKIQQVFEEQFQKNLRSLNEELSETARKVGLKDNIILLPTIKKKQTSSQTEVEDEKSLNDLKEKSIGPSFLGSKTKSSDIVIIEHEGRHEFSKITKNELKLYQRLSRLSMKTKRKRLKWRKLYFSKATKIKFYLKRKCKNLSEHLEPEKKHLKKKKKKSRVREGANEKSHSPCDSYQTPYHKRKQMESEVEKLCNSLAKVISLDLTKSSDEPLGCADETTSTLGVAIRKTVPFTTCTSTSKSYNIGLNVQQLLSLMKQRKKINLNSSTWEKMSRGTRARHFGRGVSYKQIQPTIEKGHPLTLSHPKSSPEIDYYSPKEKFWISECYSSSNFEKVRSKNSGNSPEDLYRKSTMRQCMNGRKSMIQSLLKTAYTFSSKIMVSNCQKTDIFEFGKNNNWFFNKSGYGTSTESCAKLSLEWAKVYNSFLSVYRKYSSLKDSLKKDLIVPDEKIRYLENEVDLSVEKYNEFLLSYSKFLGMNFRLKSYRMSKTFEPVTSLSLKYHGKLPTNSSTYSTKMKKAFREVQDLQNKIRIV